jgi:hypothetical protein
MTIETSTDIRRIPAPGSGILWFLDVHGNNYRLPAVAFTAAPSHRLAGQGNTIPAVLMTRPTPRRT